MKTAILATGQGSQYVGMLKDIFLQYPIAKKRLEDTNEILGFEITKILFDGPAEKLQETRYTQPALFLHTAILTDLIKDKIEFNAAAGHSVGEYAALYAAEVLDFETALKLVALRGQLMFNAGEYEPGTMFALIGGDEEKIENLCKELSNNANSDGNVIVPANYNSPGQIVISGSADYLRQNADKFKSIGAKIVKELNVSGAFHSPLMLPAKAELEKAILNEKFKDAKIPVYSNVFAKAITNSNEIRNALIMQLTEPVKWTQSIKQMANDGISSYIELGPGKVLQGLVKRIITESDAPNLKISGYDTAEDLNNI